MCGQAGRWAKDTVRQAVAFLFASRTAQLTTYDIGLTESSPGVCATSEHDILPGSSGSILPGIRCKLIDVDSKEVLELETPGELYIQSPGICLGYMNNAKATAETIVWDADGRWLRTGDVVVMRRSAQGNEHIVVVDRIKELIKTKVIPVLSSRC